jgi:hypothetical protein
MLIQRRSAVARATSKDPTPLTGSGTLSTGGGEEAWSPELLEAEMLGASETLLAILRSLARRPDEWLTVDEIAQGIPKLDGRASSDLRSIGGTLGSFGGRVKRLGMRRGPFDVRYDRATQRNQYRMDARVAAVVAAVDARISDSASSLAVDADGVSARRSAA